MVTRRDTMQCEPSATCCDICHSKLSVCVEKQEHPHVAVRPRNSGVSRIWCEEGHEYQSRPKGAFTPHPFPSPQKTGKISKNKQSVRILHDICLKANIV